LLACSVLLLTACGPVGDGDDSGTPGSGGAVRDGGTMTVALADDPDMLDPTLARTLVGRMVFMSMCEKLYDIDQKLNVVPQLAASPPGMVMSPLAARRARRRLRQFRTIELLAPRPVKSAADNLMRSLPDIWSHMVGGWWN
jgi:peptide/nickel transport system substrate-binding protein